MIMFYLFDPESYEAHGSFQDCVLYSKNLHKLIDCSGYEIWAVIDGIPFLVAERRAFWNWDVTGKTERQEGWYHPSTKIPFDVTNWATYSNKLDRCAD